MPSQWPPFMPSVVASIHCWAGGVRVHSPFAVEAQTWSPK